MKSWNFPTPVALAVLLLGTVNLPSIHADAGASALSFNPLGQPVVRFAPIPAAMTYQIEYAKDLTVPFEARTDGAFTGFQWTAPTAGDTANGFFRFGAQLLPPDRIAAYNLLNRIAYGPTPDDLERVVRIGPDAYLAEQLAAETIPDTSDAPPPVSDGWKQVVVYGIPTSSTLYLFTDGAGDVYVDDLRLVAGDDDGLKPNLLRNGGFESALTGNWVTTNSTVAKTTRTAVYSHSGTASLHLIDTDPGTADSKTRATSVYQDITPALSTTEFHTLSFWYFSPTNAPGIVIRLSGSGISANTVTINGALAGSKRTALEASTASFRTLQGWHVQRAVQSPRQLNEVLRQFIENHFVTEYSKSFDYLNNRLPTAQCGPPAARMEYRENQLWAQALLNPAVTFYDLLRISAESPAMIIYLDTVGSVGTVNAAGVITKIANENYAREILELFSFGVDNGYDQQDIVQLSRAWTGWTVELTPPGQETNPFATKSTIFIDPNAITNKTVYTNLQGQWSFIFKSANHYTGPKYIFSDHNANGTLATNQSKLVPNRFGPPWAGRAYQLKLPARTGTAGLQDGYDVLAHLANQPFTEEFLCVKLCRLFVHDEFAIGYDFSDAITTPEEDLVHQMMLAWENPSNGGPKGQLRSVLKTLFDSALFRTSLSSSQKVKTPFEYAVSVIRAFRSLRSGGDYTADTDGTSLSTSSGVINRAGRMDLFNRAEPDGYPESAPGWISAGTLAERLRYAQAALIRPGQLGHDDAGQLTFVDPVHLLVQKNVPTNNSAAVADYLLGILFPSEGAANLVDYRNLTIRFLDTANDGTTASPLASLSAVNADIRIRGAVAALLTTARFQEQ